MIKKREGIGLVAFDSFSVRSMATLAWNIFIDPGIALGPSRYGLPPSGFEIEALEKGRKDIMALLRKCKAIVISHYHYDHHPHPTDLEFSRAAYQNKIIFAKDYKKTNKSQLQRGKEFEEVAKSLAKEIVYADASEQKIGNVKLVFSKGVEHGSSAKLGLVMMTYLKRGNFSLMHCSDVQGPVIEKTAKLIIEMQPQMLIIGGPPSYFLGWKFSYKDLERVKKNLKEIIKKANAKTIVLDHHLLRDLKYKERLAEVYDYAERQGVELITAAEFMNKKILQLEARRKELSKIKPGREVEAFE